ncbi:MAG: bifunctional (p)ppGpp synthetase/guanosine-3',5'-bis(diphosphate) 3'-pyrophosphohydrolase [Holosporaceae bacterium]|nr:bifunctional (p)ppGpp synthetase/guanosine-3',5'-bis(diphosphate) 3'-pyrophosphohydrolase [Holosporaceae bacterium]
MLTSSGLINIVKEYTPQLDEDLLREAYLFAMEAHGIQKRASGSPYFSHCVEVAQNLAEYKFDVTTVISGLLHDVLEDTNVKAEQLKEMFGPEVAALVEGVTKLSKINYTSSKMLQAENLKKFLLAVTRDIRALVVKLIDRLHNMRTLNYIVSLDKRKKISLETLDIYAPLAERIGMNAVKDEMENIAFYNLYPSEYSAISTKLNQLRNESRNFIENTVLELTLTFKVTNIDVRINGREKHVYSIWKKMQNRHIGLEQINDIMAFRVIVKTTEECYRALGVIHTNFQIVPGRFKDYISIPKLNNYRSLHTTVIGPLKQPIEIQIRTEEMHQAADAGLASHWMYKKGDVVAKKDDYLNYSWVKNLLFTLQSSNSPDDIMSNSKLEMFEDKVFCFTPNGDLISLPRGATVIDFAYEIHSNIGNTCIGAKINEKMVPLKTKIVNGDQIEVITSTDQHPEADWDEFAVTGKAKACIKKFVKSKEKKEFALLGQHLIKYIFSSIDLVFNESLLDFRKFSCKSLEQFYYNVGRGVIPLSVIGLMFSSKNQTTGNAEPLCLINFSPKIAVHFADCCRPILYDQVVGVLTPQKGLVVHLNDCDNITEDEDALIKVRWSENNENNTTFMIRLRIVILNKTDSFATITNIISSNDGCIANLKIENRSTGFFELLVDIKVKDTVHSKEIQASLRACANVKSVRNLF